MARLLPTKRRMVRPEIGTPRRSRTALRLAAAFGAVLALFGIALAVVLYTFDRSAELDAEVMRLDHAKHTGRLASALVREQYIHQADTLINWDASHLGHYDEVRRRNQAATAALVAIADAPGHRKNKLRAGKAITGRMESRCGSLWARDVSWFTIDGWNGRVGTERCPEGEGQGKGLTTRLAAAASASPAVACRGTSRVRIFRNSAYPRPLQDKATRSSEREVA